jgi:hypothetical protein
LNSLLCRAGQFCIGTAGSDKPVFDAAAAESYPHGTKNNTGGQHVLQKMIKDGLRALIFWAVASVLLILFFGYTGRILSALLGMVFVVAFCMLWARVVLELLINRNRGSAPAPPPPLPGPSSAPPATTPIAESANRVCPNCGGSGRVSCYACTGTGQRYQGENQPTLCSVCGGLKTLACTACSGAGRVYT